MAGLASLELPRVAAWGRGRGRGRAIPSSPSSPRLFQGAQREGPHLGQPQLGARLEQSQPAAAPRQIPGEGTQQVMRKGGR